MKGHHVTTPTPYTPFRPNYEQQHWPMPATVPAGLSLELSRARLLPGKEVAHDEWMQMLTDRYDECLATLPAERACFEATFRHTEADGSVWMYHLQLVGTEGGGLDTSNPVDAEHEARARAVKEAGWEDLKPVFMLAPAHITDAMAHWGRTGRID
jgi:hypothetical protein